MHTISFSHARAHLAETLHAVQQSGEPAVISRRGEPSVVLMALPHYRQLAHGPAGFRQRLQAWRAGTADAADGDDPWASVRDRAPGRASPW